MEENVSSESEPRLGEDTLAGENGDSSPSGCEETHEKSSEENSEQDDMSDISCPQSASWIRQGSVLNVLDGIKNVPYTAKTKSDPFLCDGSWMVRIKWDISGIFDDVLVSKCVPIDLSQDDNPTDRKRPRRDAKVTARYGITDQSLGSVTKSKDKKRDSSIRNNFKAPARDDAEIDDSMRQSKIYLLRNIKRTSLVAAMPLTEDSDDDDDASTDAMVRRTYCTRMVTQSPTKKPRISVTAVTSDEQRSSDSDEESTKKPAARTFQSDNSENTSEVEKSNLSNLERAKQALSALSVPPEDAEAALQGVGAPYDRLQTAMLEIEKNRAGDDDELFQVFVGMEIRKSFDGTEYKGVMTREIEGGVLKKGKQVRAWKVEYNDGDEEDMEEHELLRYRHPRVMMQPCRGRQMQFLELFCGMVCLLTFSYVLSLSQSAHSLFSFLVTCHRTRYRIARVPSKRVEG